ncbi:hypothetical protein [uncultured Bacteroides sp.]|uniref:hypothetical protein n=1 Tax=uncultured Bacteroides sp. TaxID=162156 RepID=UPI002AAB50C6|nr:hypothetical protein [uncultured Bacteroides sp.]
MRNEELYIDGQLVDLDENAKVTLNYKSNIFTDLSKIVSNNSYSIKLPNTVHNQCVMDHADLPTRVSGFPRIKHKARYFRNGVEIISKANAVLMSVSSTFDVALSWGNTTAFAPIVNAGKKLTDLQYDTNIENVDYVEWHKLESNNERFPYIDYGFKDEDAEVWYHPVVTVDWILEKICKENGVRFVFPEERKDFLSSLVVPLLTRNGGRISSEESRTLFKITGVNGALLYLMSIKKGSKSSDYFYLFQDMEKVLKDGKMLFTPNFKSGRNDIWLIAGNNEKKLEYQVVEGAYKYYYNVPVEIDVQSGDHILISSKFGKIDYWNSKDVSDRSIELSIIPNTVNLGMGFPFIENLPSIKQIDFVKAIASIIGVFAVPSFDDTGVINFVSIDNLVANIPNAVDWTKKVVASYRENKPNEIAFTLDNFAQKNYFNWKDDSSVLGSYSGVIEVDDKTIDYEADLITLPFAATSMSGGNAKIPLYSYNDDGELDSKTVKPRLLILDETKCVFTGLSWDILINKHYSSYQKIIRQPIIIKEKIELREIELKELDVTIPVYLAQYGKFYAIISVKAENTGICECVLLQL